MTDDDLFRLIMGFTFAAFLPFALYYRIRSKTDEKLDRWQEGTIILVGLRISGLPCFAGSIAWMIDFIHTTCDQKQLRSGQVCAFFLP